ncbi:hypothetical protein BDZ91DRAFT_801734 [Kalaharituber pfeilii]|nr:hypothetical protein BDZ91DRAFT_801734 [Kalaharituber pfeilii]
MEPTPALDPTSVQIPKEHQGLIAELKYTKLPKVQIKAVHTVLKHMLGYIEAQAQEPNFEPPDDFLTMLRGSHYFIKEIAEATSTPKSKPLLQHKPESQPATPAIMVHGIAVTKRLGSVRKWLEVDDELGVKIAGLDNC